jgi:hypothetical protein
MSWKSLLTAGLLCVVASPAFAVPTLKVTNGGLNASGQWIWNVTIAATTGTSPVAAELGFRETTAGAQLVSATAGAPFTGVNTQNPGTQIFTWETTDPTANGKPVGLQTNLTLDEIFAAMGSFADVPNTDTQYLTILTKGPTATTLTSTIQVLGKYAPGGGAGANGRIAEITTAPNATNYNNFAGNATRTAKAGDANLSGMVDVGDVGILATNFGALTGKNWTTGDFNGDGAVNVGDVGILATNFGQAGGSVSNLTIAGAPGGGSGSSLGVGAVPEPATLVTLVLAGGLVSCFGGRRRRS